MSPVLRRRTRLRGCNKSTKNTRDIPCIFCLKPVPPPEGNGKVGTGTATPAADPNLENLESFLNLESCSNYLLEPRVCQDCVLLLESFSRSYEQLKLLEAKLEWKISSFGKIIKLSGRVPSRVAYVKEVYSKNIRGGLRTMEEVYSWRKRASTKCLSMFPSSCSGNGAKTTGTGTTLISRNKERTVDNIFKSLEHKHVQCNMIEEALNCDVEIHDTPGDPPLENSFMEDEPLDHIFMEDDTFSSAFQFDESILGGIEPSIIFGLSNELENWESSMEEGAGETPTKENTKQEENAKLEENVILKCSVCPKSNFKLVSARNRHMKQCHGFDPKKMSKCDEDSCTAYFRTPAQLKRHKSEFHHEPTDNQDGNDEVEGEEEEDKPPLLGHVNRRGLALHQAQQKCFPCSQCGKVLKSKGNLEVHALIHAGPAGWNFPCPTCGKKYMTKHRLTAHEKLHRRKSSRSCGECRELFPNSKVLEKHVRKVHA